jgi:hypothetical protein
MVLDAEKVRFAVEYVTRVANDFGSTNMFFVKNCSLLFRAIPQPHANERWSPGSIWHPRASLASDSVMSFETEEFGHFRGRDPVSAYPLIRLIRDFFFQLSKTDEGMVSTITRETLPEQLLEFLIESLAKLVMLITGFDDRLVSIQDLEGFQIVMQVEIYDLTSSERVKRGVKRAWLIGETLALETGS